MTRSLKLSKAESTPSTEPIPFPNAKRAEDTASREGDNALSAISNVSRRLEDLARKLNCLGFFDETDPDRPRAA